MHLQYSLSKQSLLREQDSVAGRAKQRGGTPARLGFCKAKWGFGGSRLHSANLGPYGR